jgi:hypothetical protein
MRRHLLACLAAAGLIAAAATALAQSPDNQTAGQNVQQSRQYESLLCTNPEFRAKRIAQECGPLQGSQFYNSCVASFQCGTQPKHSNKAPPSETIK